MQSLLVWLKTKLLLVNVEDDLSLLSITRSTTFTKRDVIEIGLHEDGLEYSVLPDFFKNLTMVLSNGQIPMKNALFIKCKHMLMVLNLNFFNSLG